MSIAVFENREKLGKTYMIIIIILFLVGIVVYFVFGADSIMKGIIIFFEIILVLATLFALAYLFYYLFIKKSKFDVNYVNKKKLEEAGKKQKRSILKDLYLSGDKGHSRVKIGKIQGYLRIQTLTRKYIYEDIIDKITGRTTKKLVTMPNERGEEIAQYELESIEQDVFIVAQGFMSESMVVRVNPEDHNELVGDVDLYGFSLIPICEYHFLNNDHLDVRKVDYSILKEAERTVSFVILSDMKDLIDRATGIDASHKKGIEAKSLVEIPETKSAGQPQSPYG